MSKAGDLLFGSNKAKERIDAPFEPKRENIAGEEDQFDPAFAKRRKRRRGRQSSILTENLADTLG